MLSQGGEQGSLPALAMSGPPPHRRRTSTRLKDWTKRLCKELADNYVDEALEAYDVDETPER
jgi:hypothetical protein